MKKPTAAHSWLPAKYEDADIYAIRALASGTATEAQQRRALDWIINHAAMTYDQPFRPGGAEGARETDFAAGRMFVGQQIVKLTKLIPANATEGG